MKIRIFIYFAVFISVLISGCRVKETCELNHTGQIFVTNNTGNVVEVYIDNTKIFTLNDGITKSINKPVGTYTVKCLSFPEEWIQQAVVTECKSTELIFPE